LGDLQRIVWPTAECRCYALREGHLLYSDDNYVSISGSESLAGRYFETGRRDAKTILGAGDGGLRGGVGSGQGVVDGLEFFEDGAEFGGFEGVGAVGLGFFGIVVDFHEDAVDAGGDGGAGE